MKRMDLTSMNASDLQYLLGMAGTVAFAVTAVLAVSPRGIDLFGASVLGLITAIGGGTLRDLILGVPVFWASDLNYIWVALVSSVVAFVGNRLIARKNIYRAMLYVDALGVSMFAIQAVHKVMALEFGMTVAPVLLGVLTAIGGGLIRDVLAGNPTLLMTRDLYAIPITMGCILYVGLLSWLPGHSTLLGPICAALIFGFRAAAIHWNLRVPEWMVTRAHSG